MMRNMFMQRAPSPAVTSRESLTPEPEHEAEPSEATRDTEFHSFASEVKFYSDSSSESDSDDEAGDTESEIDVGVPRKRRKLDIQYKVQRKLKQEEASAEQAKALVDLEKLLK